MAVTLITTGVRGGGHRLVGHIGDPLGRHRCPYTPMNGVPVQVEFWDGFDKQIWAKTVPGTRIRGKMMGNVRIWLCYFCATRTGR